MSSSSTVSENRGRAFTVVVAWVLVVTALAISAPPADAAPDETFADDFSPAGFAGSDGSLIWAQPWEENGETNGPTTGSIRVGNEPHCATDPCLLLGREPGPDASATRQIDLSGYATAELSFDYATHRHPPGSGTASLWVSANGGTDFDLLDSWPLNSDSSGTVTYDLTNYMATDTVIRFGVIDSTDDSHMNIDNVAIGVTHWVEQTTPTNEDLFKVQFPVDDSTGFVVGDTGTILKTTDSGGLWTALASPTSNNLRDLDFPESNSTGYAVGMGDTLIKTTNGTNWSSQSTPTAESLLGVDFIDNNVGYVVGTNGTILKTVNGGANWVQQTSGSSEDLRDVTFPITDQIGYAVGTAGTILATADGGASWLPQPSGTTEDINSIQFPVDPNNGYAVGDTGIVLKTVNGGSSWQLQNAAGDDLHDLHFPGDTQHGHVAVNQGIVIATDSSATTWATEPVPTSEDLLGIWFADQSSGWTVGRSGVIFAIGSAPGGANAAPVFDQDLLDRTNAEGTLIGIASPATDPDVGDSLSYSATGLPEGISIGSASGDIVGALGPNAAGTHSVTVTVTDDGTPNLLDTDSFTWTVTPGAVTYLVASSGGANGGDDLLTVVDRSNPDPATNEINIGTGTGTDYIEAAAVQPGTNVLFAVEDNQLGTIDITTGVFTPKPAIAGAGNGSEGLIAFNSIEGISFNPFTGELYATRRRGPSQSDLLLQLDPATGAHVSGAFGGDDYVVIAAQSPYFHAADIAHDPGDGQLFLVHWSFVGNWSLATLNPATGATSTRGVAPNFISSLAFDDAGRLYTSTNAPGTEVLYELNPGDGSLADSIVIDNGTEYQAMAIALATDPNLPPVFDQNLPNRTDTEGTAISLSASATDPDAGDNLTYTATGLPPGLGIDAGSGLISGTVGIASSGAYPVVVSVIDDGVPNLSAPPDTFTWTITEVNQAPAFDQDLPNRTDAEGTAISLSASASDPDGGDTLTYGATGLPPGLSIDTGSGLVTGTIDFTAAATSPYSVTVTAIDDGTPNLSAPPDTFIWTVTNTNQPPVIVNPGAQTTPELAPFSIVVTASDADGTIPGFADSGTLPAWATLTDNLDGTATIAGTPGFGGSGTTTVTITASDGSLSDDAVFDLTVTNTNVAPTIINPGNQPGNEGSPFSALLTASDPDGTTVSFTDSGSLPAWATLTDNGDDTATITGTPGYSDAGTTTVTVTASDGSLTDDAVFDIVVANANRPPVVDPIADQTVAEGNGLIPLVASAADPDGTIPAVLASGLPAWATFVDNGDGTGTITGTPGYNDAATTTVTVQAFDGSLFGTTTFDLIVSNTNRPPVLDAVADQTIAEGTPLPPITVTAIDPDGAAAALAASGLPAWASFTDNGDGTGTITGTPGYNDAAMSTVTIYAEDGGTPNLADTTTFDIDVTNTNRPPSVDPPGNQSIAENSALTLTVTATDPDGTTPGLTAAGLPGWATLVDNGDGTGTITGTPDYNDAATSSVTITASDGAATGTSTFALTVTNTNRQPVVGNIPDQTVPGGGGLSVAIAATDPDGTVPALTATGLPGWATLVDNGDGTGTIAGTPTNGDAGIASVSAIASDGDLTGSETFTLTVTVSNRAPIFNNDLPNRADAEGETIALSGAATDPDSDPMLYTATGLPPGITINPTTGNISGMVGFDAAGSWTVEIVAADNGVPVLTATDTFVWAVTNTNRAPILQPLAAILGTEHTPIVVSPTATDPDGDVITYSIAGEPPGATIDPTTGVLTWTPGEIHGNSSYPITISATDNGLPVQTATEIVTITVTEKNSAPSVGPLSDQHSNVGDSASLPVPATDPDIPINNLTYTATGLPAGLTINTATGVISGTVSSAGAGVHTVRITVTDHGSPRLASTGSLTWVVGDGNHPPSLSSVPNLQADEMKQVTFTTSATDPDGHGLIFSLRDAPDGAAMDRATGEFSWTPTESQGPAIHSFTVAVTDNGSPRLTSSTTVTITVAEVNQAPVIASMEDRQDKEGQEVSVVSSASDLDFPANRLSFSATGLPPGLTISPTTGLITGLIEIGEATPGPYTVIVAVDDDGDPTLRAVTNFTWLVASAATNDRPVVTDIADQYADAGASVELAVQATDAERLSYSATGLPPGVAINPSSGLISGAVDNDAIGIHRVTITVTDAGTPQMHTATEFSWTVTDREAADQKIDLVVTIDDTPVAPTPEQIEAAAESRPVRRGLVVMGSAAAATTEKMRLPLALLLALLIGFATVGRIGLYPLLWRGERHDGIISFYDDDLEFGLVHPDSGGEPIFVHAHAFPRRQRATLVTGLRIRYRVLAGDNRASAWGATTEVGNG